jgi:hypothetical protein
MEVKKRWNETHLPIKEIKNVWRFTSAPSAHCHCVVHKQWGNFVFYHPEEKLYTAAKDMLA